MEKIKVWNNQGYFEYLEKDELFDYSNQTIHLASEPLPQVKETAQKHERYCWIEAIEKAEKEKQTAEVHYNPKHYSKKYDTYFDTDDVYSVSISGSFNSIAYGKTNDYLNKEDFNYREYGSRFGSSVVCDDYDN